MHQEVREPEEKLKALSRGPEKNRYYQPGQLDLVARYWSRAINPTGAPYSAIGCLLRPTGWEWVYSTDPGTHMGTQCSEKYWTCISH